MRFCAQMLLVLLTLSTAAELESFLQRLERTPVGQALLKTITIRFKAGDPVERVVDVMESLRNQNSNELDEVQNEFQEREEECEKAIKQYNDRISDLNAQSREAFSQLAQIKPHLTQMSSRFQSQKKLLEDLKYDLERQDELRDTQNKLYLYNVDNLEGALFALSEVRKMFVRYMQNQEHRRKILGQGDSFLQMNGIDVEAALNEDFRDDVDDDDDLEDRRIHYQHFVFVEIQVGIRKARDKLEGVAGVQEVLMGFEELASIMHDIHTESNLADDLAFIQEGEDRQQSLDDIAQLVVDICNRIGDWIAQLRRWEDKTEDTKHKLYLKLEKAIKQAIQETQVDVDKLANSYKTLTSQVEQLTHQKEYAEQRMESFKVQLDDKTKECQWLEHSHDNDSGKLNEEVETLNDVLGVLETSGGQLRQLIAAKTIE